MCYVIVTSRSLCWLLLTIVATMCILSALMTPKWLIGTPKTKTWRNETVTYHPSVGIYNRCTLINGRNYCGAFSFEGFDADNSVFPNVWKAALFFMALGLTIMCTTILSGIMSFCFRAICRKSIFSLSGTFQALAGVCFIVAMLLYPWGWDSPRVQWLCGYESAPYYLDKCSIGWAFYCGVAGVILTFLCSFLSIAAEKATSSNRVQLNIRKGKTLICLP